MSIMWNKVHKAAFASNVFTVARMLKKRYGDMSHHNQRNPLDELFFIMCSVKRSEKVYLKAYRTLK
jgi:hypothetical protein